MSSFSIPATPRWFLPSLSNPSRHSQETETTTAMKASEYITALQGLIEKHGDLEVKSCDERTGDILESYPSFASKYGFFRDSNDSFAAEESQPAETLLVADSRPSDPSGGSTPQSEEKTPPSATVTHRKGIL